MAQTTSIDVDDSSKELLDSLTKRGRYSSTSEAIHAALRLLEREEAKMNALEEALTEGENSGESNRSIDEIVKKTLAQFKMEPHGS